MNKRLNLKQLKGMLIDESTKKSLEFQLWKLIKGEGVFMGDRLINIVPADYKGSDVLRFEMLEVTPRTLPGSYNRVCEHYKANLHCPVERVGGNPILLPIQFNYYLDYHLIDWHDIYGNESREECFKWGFETRGAQERQRSYQERLCKNFKEFHRKYPYL